MEPSGTPSHRLPADVLAEWRRLERLNAAGLGDEAERQLLVRRIGELRAEYRIVVESIRETPDALDLATGLEAASGSLGWRG